MNNKLKWIGIRITIFLVYYIFIFSPKPPEASIKVGKQTYVLKAKTYDFPSYGKKGVKTLKYQSVRELHDLLDDQPEVTVKVGQNISYKNDAPHTYTIVFYESVDQNKSLNRIETNIETNKVFQTITKPGHYILTYRTDFGGEGTIADYFVKVHVVKWFKNHLIILFDYC